MPEQLSASSVISRALMAPRYSLLAVALSKSVSISMWLPLPLLPQLISRQSKPIPSAVSRIWSISVLIVFVSINLYLLRDDIPDFYYF